jgi:DNA modification methylase
MMTEYYMFLENKIEVDAGDGVTISAASLHPSCYPHQVDAITWALRNQRALIAARYGLGKTQMQCEIARRVHESTGQRFLVICPLGVKTQFVNEDGPRLDMRWQYVRTDEEIEAADTPYLITNYERVRDGNIDPRIHNIAGVSLDEAATLRNMATKTYGVFSELLGDIPYRYVCTATPAPNQFREIIYYAQFLGIMDSGQILTRWFKRDPEKAGNLQIHPQHEREFWLWVASWALFLYSPSDLGYDDTGYDLPELRVHWHRLPVDQTRAWDHADNRGQHLLLLDTTLSATAATSEKRATLPARIEQMLSIISTFEVGNEPPGQFIVWCHLNDEQRAIERALGEVGISYSSIYGSLDPEETERRLYEWKGRQTTALIVKPSMFGYGVNLQYNTCHNVFLGITFGFEDFVQAIHRTYRFQQTQPVDVHIIYSESEDKVADTLKAKWQRHDELTERMRQIVREYGLSRQAIHESLRRKLGVDRQEHRGELFTAVRNDCVVELMDMADDSIDLIVSSYPFSRHYEYSVQVEDFGHNQDDAAFFKQMDFLLPQLYRVLKPGRVAFIHAKDLILYGHANAHGFMEIDPFSDMCVTAMRQHGFIFGGRRTLTTDVVRENNGTYRLGYTEMTKDATKMGSGLPEYLLMFRKPPTSSATARADEPVTKDRSDYTVARWQIDAHAYWRSDGNTLVPRSELYDYEAHVARLEALDEAGNLPKTYFCEPPASNNEWVWDDINPMFCLNAQQSRRKAIKHICPLPFQIVERAIRLYSNPGDLVFDPFLGIGTVAYCALKLGRRAYGTELNEQYWEDAVYYCSNMERGVLAPTLFDVMGIPQEVAA